MGGEDRLSELPDALLQEILGLLPLDDLVRTSVVSRRWRSLWATAPVLDFTSIPQPKRIPAYFSVMRHVLRLLPEASPGLHLLALELEDSWPDPFQILDLWLYFATARFVRHLRLVGCVVPGLPSPFIPIPNPGPLFLCTSLRILSLANVTLPLSSSSSGFVFPFLTGIYLSDSFVTGEAVNALLAACPRAEELGLRGCEPLGRLVVRSPTLRTLEVLERRGRRGVASVEIEHAPELTTLMLRCDLMVVKPLEVEEDDGKLEDVVVFSQFGQGFETRSQWLQFLEGMGDIRTLSVNHWFLQFVEHNDMYLPIFADLGELHLCDEPFTLASLRALVWCLKGSGLDELHVHVNHGAGKSDDPIPEGDNISENEFWEQIQHVVVDDEDEYGMDCDGYSDDESWGPSRVWITGFSGKKEEMILVKLLIEQAVYMKFLRIYYVKEIGEQKLDEIMKEIESYPKAHQRSQVSFFKLPRDYSCPPHQWWDSRVLDPWEDCES